MNQTTTILSRQAAEIFQPGRESIWALESPVIADGAMFDILRHAQDHTIHAQASLASVITSSAEYLDQTLAGAEDDLRRALAKVSELRQRAASVPSTFGQVR